jgi:hypothetical protein
LAKGITYSEPHGTDAESPANAYDTAETVKQVKEHDLVYETTCSK